MSQESEATGVPDKDERMWGMLCHLIAFSGFVVPFGSLLGPLIIWLIKKDEMPFVDDQGKESLNFQLTMLIAFIISIILIVVVIGILLLGVLCIYEIVVLIIATIKANEGVRYRYPYTIRFIK
ncbi:MAG: DUF4870 domain-containing protein [Gammaproteobacteria bacterium]